MAGKEPCTARRPDIPRDETEAMDSTRTTVPPSECRAVRSAIAEVQEIPNSIEECRITDSESGCEIYDFKKAKAFLYAKMRAKDDPWLPSTETALALVKTPGKEEPFGLGIFTPQLPQGKDRKRILENGKLLTVYDLVKAGLPRDEALMQLAEALQKQGRRNLAVARRDHVEIRFTDKINLTANVVYKRYRDVRNRETAARENKNVVEAVKKAEAVYSRVVARIGALQAVQVDRAHGEEAVSIFKSIKVIPERFFENSEETRKKTINLLTFLDRLGMVNLTNALKAGDEGLFAIVEALNKLTTAQGKAVRFLEIGENLFKGQQKRYRERSIKLPIDRADFMEDLKNMDPYELLEYAFDTDNPIDYRKHAVSFAFIAFKFLSIKQDPHVRYATDCAIKLRKALIGAEWEYRDAAKRHLDTETHTYFENPAGDKALEEDDEFDIENTMKCRKWISPLSGREYHVRIVDEANVEKTEESVLFKSLLKNSGGEPSNLFDLVRFTLVFANVPDLSDPVVRKDIYYLFYQVATAYGMRLKLKPDQVIDWHKDSTDTILGKVWQRGEEIEITEYDGTTRKEKFKLAEGEFTFDDKTKGKRNMRSANGFEDIKIICRDPHSGTGMEIQAHKMGGRYAETGMNGAGYLEASSPHHPIGHVSYNAKKTQDLLPPMNAPSIYPNTHMRNEAHRLRSEEYSLRYRLRITRKRYHNARIECARIARSAGRQPLDVWPQEKREKFNQLRILMPEWLREIKRLEIMADVYKERGIAHLRLCEELFKNGEDLSQVEGDKLMEAAELVASTVHEFDVRFAS